MMLKTAYLLLTVTYFSYLNSLYSLPENLPTNIQTENNKITNNNTIYHWPLTIPGEIIL